LLWLSVSWSAAETRCSCSRQRRDLLMSSSTRSCASWVASVVRPALSLACRPCAASSPSRMSRLIDLLLGQRGALCSLDSLASSSLGTVAAWSGRLRFLLRARRDRRPGLEIAAHLEQRFDVARRLSSSRSCSSTFSLSAETTWLASASCALSDQRAPLSCARAASSATASSARLSRARALQLAGELGHVQAQILVAALLEIAGRSAR